MVRSVINEVDAIRIPYFPNPGPTTSELKAGLEVEGIEVLGEGLDGVVIGGTGALDESSITGESIPVEKVEGDKVVIGDAATAPSKTGAQGGMRPPMRL